MVETGVVEGAAVGHRLAVPYGHGKVLDVYRAEASAERVAELLWHGSGADERQVLAPLAREIASAGLVTVLPDWSPDDPELGRAHLLASISYTLDPLAGPEGIDRLVLAGWSRGASMGLRFVLDPPWTDDWRPAAFVGISGGYQDALSNAEPVDGHTVDRRAPIVLIHGINDEVVPVEGSRAAILKLRAGGWSVARREVEADHAGVIGTRFDSTVGRCVPSDHPATRAAMSSVSSWIVQLGVRR